MPSYLLRRDLIFWYLQDDLDVLSLLVNVRSKECGKWRRGDFVGCSYLVGLKIEGTAHEAR